MHNDDATTTREVTMPDTVFLVSGYAPKSTAWKSVAYVSMADADAAHATLCAFGWSDVQTEEVTLIPSTTTTH